MRCQISHRLRRGKAAGQQRRLLRRLHNVGFTGLLLAVLAGVGVVHVLAHPELCRLHLQCSANLFADLNHLAATGRTSPFVLRQAVLHYLGGSTLRNDIQHIAGLPFALVRLHGDLLLCGGLCAKGVGLQFLFN